MQITKAKDLQLKFKSGLQIVGEEDNKLQWMGTDQQWKECETCGKISERYAMEDAQANESRETHKN